MPLLYLELGVLQQFKGWEVYSRLPVSPLLPTTVLLRQSNLVLSVLGRSRIPRTYRDPPFMPHPGFLPSGQHGQLCERDTKGGSQDVQGISSGQDGGLCLRGHQGQGILRTAWGLVCEGKPREDSGMSKGSSRQHGGLSLRGHQGRIPGCPRNPPECLDTCSQHWTSLGCGK